MAASATTAAAEDNLSKEITVEREIVPEVRAASRLNLFPRAITYRPQGKELSLSEPDNEVNAPATIAALEPAATAPATEPTPWRGYVNAGYFPAANVALSAGYAILSNETDNLNIWGQLNNKSYRFTPEPDAGKEAVKRLSGHVGVDFSHRFGSTGTLELATGLGFHSFNQPWSFFNDNTRKPASSHNQSVIDWKLSAMWHGKGGNNLDYHIGAGFDIFNFSKGLSIPLDDAYADNNDAYDEAAGNALYNFPVVHQTGFNVDFGVKQSINSESAAGVDLTADFLHYNHFEGGSGKTLGVASLKPYYRFGNDVVTLKAGLRMDLTINSGKAFHVAPDVLLGVTPASGFGAWLRIGGGEELNSMRTLFDFSPYVSQTYAYGVSNIPVKGDLGLRFGPFHGASITFGVAYGAANNWLLPVMDNGQLLFGRHDLRSWKGRAAIHWDFKKIVSVDASFETRFGNGEKEVWMEWRDRARHRFTAAVALRPIEKLTIDVSYELRSKRSMPMLSGYDGENLTNENGQLFDVDLKDVNNLGVGATYRITDAFSVFARVENIIDSKTYLLPLLPDQGFTGLVGVSFKF